MFLDTGKILEEPDQNRTVENMTIQRWVVNIIYKTNILLVLTILGRTMQSYAKTVNYTTGAVYYDGRPSLTAG